MLAGLQEPMVHGVCHRSTIMWSFISSVQYRMANLVWFLTMFKVAVPKVVISFAAESNFCSNDWKTNLQKNVLLMHMINLIKLFNNYDLLTNEVMHESAEISIDTWFLFEDSMSVKLLMTSMLFLYNQAYFSHKSTKKANL